MTNDPPEGRARRADTLRADILIDQWFLESFGGSRVAQSTETWNLVHAAKEELKRRLAASDQPEAT